MWSRKHATGDSFEVSGYIKVNGPMKKLSINNPGGFLFQADLEKSNNVSESLSSNNQGRFLFQVDFGKRNMFLKV